MDLLHISVWYIKGLSLGALGGSVVPGSLGCTEGPEPEFASCFESGKNSSAVYLVFECLCWFAGVAFGAHHPNLLLHSCTCNSSVPICITLVLVLLHWGLADLVPGAQSL